MCGNCESIRQYEDYLADYACELLGIEKGSISWSFPNSVLIASEDDAREWVRQEVAFMQEHELGA